MATEGKLQVGVKDEYLDTVEVTQTDGQVTHREMVSVGDPDTLAARAAVSNTVAEGYGLVTRPVLPTDAFGRIRVSNPTTLFDSKQIFDKQTLFWDDQEVSGSGTSSTYSKARASTVIAVGSGAGKRVRQTFQRFNYQPGKSLLILCTGRLDTAPGTGIDASMGYFDDDNGAFMRSKDGVLSVVIRSSVTGSADDSAVDQADWNGDKLDGTGPSGVTLDLTKVQIVYIDFEWLGVGSVRFGFVIDGRFILAHQFNHANDKTSVYMSLANLPLRFSIENTGGGSATGLEHICSTVISEGGSQKTGVVRYKSTEGTHVDANTADTIYAVVGLRLKTTHLAESITLEGITAINQQVDDFEWLLLFNPTVAGTFTYSDETNSAIQTATGATANTVTGGTASSGGVVKSSNSSGQISAEVPSALRLGAAIDGTRDTLVLCVRPLSANADIEGSISWREAT
jgi:hypothetical protein